MTALDPQPGGQSSGVYSDQGRWQVSRSRGAVSGFMLLLLGLWGALIPFLGPTFNYAFTPDTSWTWTAGRFWLQVLPGAAVALCGLVLMFTASRALAVLAGWVAAVGGGWFIVGPTISVYWADTVRSSDGPGVPDGSQTARVLEQIGFFSGLGGLIVFFAALALGRLTVHSVRDARAAEQRQAQYVAEPTVPVDAYPQEPGQVQPDVQGQPGGQVQPGLQVQPGVAARTVNTPAAAPGSARSGSGSPETAASGSAIPESGSSD